MTTILDEILAVKQKEVERLKDVNTWNFPENPKETHALTKVLKQKEDISIIAEFKRASPSKGIINTDADPVKQAIRYMENGADVISVLTDSIFFKGSYYDLQDIQNAVNLPVLCKDFVIDEVQIHRALHVGATVVLLIAAALTDQKLKQLYRYASSLSLDAIVEVHNEEELERALAIDASIIGVNNRDLKTFTIDISTSEKLGPVIRKEGKFFIAESGIQTKDDVIRVRDAGAHAILVGEAFMTSRSVKETISDFKVPVLKG
ncbi:indole-3-glycerol phosphate synthase [Bacillus oleivorans]|uniref:Indole-3-glycerol phosphate synthase n=1 Tax=Bacillus oleivorans TaxID=1448271 RepID=A0A285CN41_9BACI|nr:indole-3-glycerol phosphate synthase TrpC [Bacillus oleivorans]SNX68413.1 indole-3-glycerol phosphate synthase [Bacillus oleivorans]